MASWSDGLGREAQAVGEWGATLFFGIFLERRKIRKKALPLVRVCA
jgi:hypothetical protein